MVRRLSAVGSPLAVSKIISGRPLVRSPSAVAQSQMIRSWFDVCTEQHVSSCPRPRPSRPPTRLIDVREWRLILTNREMRTEWVCLSHCWGRSKIFVMTGENIEALEGGLDGKTLPATYSDAIRMTELLGFRYLWIDSLCIMQDSPEDWAREAVRMHEYYKLASLTIAVDSASGDNEGFLSRLRDGDSLCTQVSIRSKLLGKPCSANIRLNVPRSGPFISKTRLTERAWALQEDLLSPRSVRFTTDQLRWECQGCRVTEADQSPVGISPTEAIKVTKRYFLHPEALKDTTYIKQRPSDQQFFEPMRRWYNILNEYVTRKLTFADDRLVAIHGLAQEIGLQTGFEYVWGLWKEDMHTGLFWQLNAEGSQPKKDRAPSWSWAALDYRMGHLPHENISTAQHKLMPFRYGAWSVAPLPDEDWRRARLKIHVANRELQVQSYALPLKSWQSSIVFRAYWRAPMTHLHTSGRYPPKYMLICSFDTNPGTQHPENDSSNDQVDDESSWEASALKDVLIVQIAAFEGARTSEFQEQLHDGEPDVEVEGRPGYFRRVGSAEVPTADNLHRKGWIGRQLTII